MEFGAVQNTQKDFQTQPFNPVPNQEEPAEGGASAIDFWGILRRRFFLICFFILVAVGGGVLYMLNATKIYTAKAEVQIFKKAHGTAIGREELMNMFNGGQGGTVEAKRHVSSFASNAILEKVLIKEGVIKLTTFSNISDKFDEKVRKYISANLSIAQTKDNENLYQLAFSSPSSDDAAEFLNQLVRAYREELVGSYKADVNKSLRTIEKLSDKYNKELKLVENELAEFRRSHSLEVLDTGGKSVYLMTVTEKSKELAEAKKSLKELSSVAREVESWKLAARTPEQILELVIKIPKENDGEYLESRNMDHEQKYISQLSTIENQIKLLSEKLGPKNSKIKQLVATRDSLRSLLIAVQQEDIGAVAKMDPADRLELEVDKLKNDIEFHSETAKVLQIEIETARQKAEAIVKNLKQEEELLKKRTFVQDQLKEVTANLARVKLEEEGDVYKFEIMKIAPEGELSHPLPLKVFGISIVLGCLSGFGLAYLVDLADKTFRSPHEIIKSLNLALIGHIPVIQTPNRKKLANQDVHPVICSFHKPKSQSAEAFRAVRTSLYFSVQGQRHQVIQVTSPTPGDGKSTLAANLATVIAQSGKSVLLVDGDFRRPSVQKIFEINETPGFSDVLVQQVSIEEAVQQTPVEGLEILACGNKPLQPSELLTSHRLPEVIDELREMYDFVVIDTPPVLLVTDPCPVAANVDGVICAMRIKKNVRVNAERMVEILRSVNANILGVVVNGVGAQGNYASQYNYGAYQAGYSQYGYGAYGYGRYGQSEKVYDDGRKASLSVPRQQLIESSSDDDFMS